MMSRETELVRLATPNDAARIRKVLLHKDVASTFFSLGVSAIADSNEAIIETMSSSLWLIWEGGIFLATPIVKNSVECHVAVLPKWRGARALDAARRAIEIVFTTTHAGHLFGSTPSHHSRALAFLNAVGFHTLRVDGGRSVSSLSFPMWAMSQESPRDIAMSCAVNGQIDKAAYLDRVYGYTTRTLKHG